MKLNKAIEALAVLENEPYVPRGSDRWDAIKLGIEALKRIKYQRNFKITHPERKLPGETED